MKKVLLIEDDAAISAGIELLLASDEIEVFCENDGLNGYERAKALLPDLLLLDVNLPSMNGFSICSKLKEEGYPFPIFILTCLDDMSSRLKGLSYGADDYITKPFNSSELQLRIKNILIRSEKLLQTVTEFDNDLSSAKDIQLKSLPTESPHTKDLDIFGKLVPAKQVSGDYYDYLQIDDDRLALVTADVMGKGMPAALYVQKMQGILHSNKENINSALDIIKLLQNFLELQDDWYVSVASTFFDLKEKTVEMARAGHPPVFLKNKDHLEMIKSPGFPIGLNNLRAIGLIKDDQALDKFKLNSGDNFLFYSDGVIEAKNCSGEFFGTKRLKSIFQNSSGDSQEVVNSIFTELEKFSGHQIQSDDVTLVSVIVN
jgi:phosphoserine phosphatase RsbU/P